MQTGKSWRDSVSPDALREDDAAPAPWSYHRQERYPIPYDWIEDANGNTVIEHVGYIDGPRIVRAVNAMAQRDGIISVFGRLHETEAAV